MTPPEPKALAAGGPTKASLRTNSAEQHAGGRPPPLSAPQALANVLAISARHKRPEASDATGCEPPPEEFATTLTPLDEWTCNHEWTLRIGGWYGFLEAYCAKCGELAPRGKSVA